MRSRIWTKAGVLVYLSKILIEVKDLKHASCFRIQRNYKFLKVNHQKKMKYWIATTNHFLILMVNQIWEEDQMPIQTWTEENLKASHQLTKADQRSLQGHILDDTRFFVVFATQVHVFSDRDYVVVMLGFELPSCDQNHLYAASIL